MIVRVVDEWNTRLREKGGHLLQSWQWGDFKRQGGWCPERISIETASGTAMAQVLFLSRGPVSIRYIPRGPVFAGRAAGLWPELLGRIDRAARRHRAISVIVEADRPDVADAPPDAMFVPVENSIQPMRTVKVPLLDDDALLKQMYQKTRYNVRLAPRRGVRLETLDPTPENLARFHTLLRDTSNRNRFGIHSLAYNSGVLDRFGDAAALLGAWTEDGHLAAALIVARFGGEAIYLYGASSTQHRAHGAGVAIQFAAMKWARERGASVYDLWGIPPVDPDSTTTDGDKRIAGSSGRDWRGLFRFKTGFGGEIVGYPGPMERRYVPFLPALARRLGYVSG